MNHSMMSSLAMVLGQRAVAAVLGTTLLVTSAGAQAAPSPRVGADSWRVGASVGVWSPRAPVVLSPTSGDDARLNAASSVSLDVQYNYSSTISTYANGLLSFTTLARGTMLRATSTSADQVTMLGATAGMILAPRWLGDVIRPTLRVGGGYKGYRFNRTDVDAQWRPTGDFGIGFRAGTAGPIEVSAETRYLPSSFDQGKLPLRSVVPQVQRQTDLLFSIGVSVRP